MKILISNDDGVHAQGINILFKTLREIADVTIVAPSMERSATGQTLTLDQPLRIDKLEEGIYQTSGFPADCTLMGINHILNERPDLVISGINHGANLGQDIYYSGTVAAARQAVFQGIPAIAVSTVIDSRADQLHLQTAANFVRKLVEHGSYKWVGKDEMININVPNLSESDIAGVELTKLGKRIYSEEIEHRLDSRGKEYFWIGGKLLGNSGGPGTDGHAIENSKISINILNLFAQVSDISNKWSEIVG
ncbi:5'/3'-nucleotidase SurE [Bacteriovorax sp. Seq25_V]|uniref:5'/3'-nucleotidase SurE n=1 Tax=Bacteriovorax sp. Seq25_V TaxID=1201288 RepID=UPI000389DB8A|nr:5'/3'-nucleotidase SurE [Bacteriovorax sp. Seq25_V]EQC44225.1 5'/3'-nucleotidase SurE [Bacteriovorax sp. Seq25_V]